jgi:hypothetical protein
MKYQVQRWNNNRISYIHFGYADFFDFDNFVIQIMENLKVDVRYSIMLKVNFNEDRYAMLGKQMGFRYSDDEYVEKLEYFHNLCKNLVNNLWDDYDVENIKSIQVLYVLINDIPKLQLKNVNKVDFNKGFTNVKESRERFNLIPLTVDTNYYGRPVINTDDFTSFLNKINDQRDLLNQNKLDIAEDCKMYLYNDSLIIISNTQEGKTYHRDVYDAKLGVLIHEIKDVIIADNHFVRTIGNVGLTIIDNNIAKMESVKVLSPITHKDRSLKDEANPFIGSWDVEAFEVDGYAKVYALGFKVLNQESRMYYMDNGVTSDQLVLQCIDDMLANEYNGYTFYTHNFGKYDSVFLMKILKEANIALGYEHYITKELDRGGKMLKLVIKVKRSISDRKIKKIGARKDPGYNTITIVDSLNLLSQSLADLCKSFEVEVTKGYFPYSFVKSNTLHYVGNTPDIKYWEKISLEEYNKLLKSDWSLKEECLKYLDKDLSSLVLIMNKFSEYVNRKYYLQVTDSLTISRLALNIFMKDYLKNSKLPIINRNIFSDIKQAYYGGVTEVYKPYGKNLLHYDVNSLYPFAALNAMPGTKCTYIENLNSTINIKDLFGFFYCEIKAVDNYLGLLPVHHEEGMIMPNGSWKGWYFSEELKFAADNGYTINVLKGYTFNMVNDVFTNYVKDLYKIKASTNDKVEKDIAKRLLNHLLGRFGLNINKPVTRYVNGEELELLFSTREIIGKPVKITNNDYKVTYNSLVDPDICSDHGIDYIKVQNLTTKTDVENVNEFKDVSLSTAAAVTAYARIYMSKVKLDILDKGGSIYYTDTDSIVTDIPLKESLVGDELGQFKLEYKIKQGYYISNKTYYVDLAEKLWDKRTNTYTSSVIKSKTVSSKSLSLESFEKLYNNQNVGAVKRSSIRNYDKGSVLIVDKTVEISHDAYTKREKIYKRKKWVDTKPLVLDGYLKKKDTTKNVTWKAVMSSKLWNRLLDFVFGLAIILVSFTTQISMEDFELDYSCNETSINLDLERLIELRYNDDYLEEPVEVEIYHESTYLDMFKSFFKKQSSTFYELFNNLRYNTEGVKHDISIKSPNSGYVDIAVDGFTHERPQVMTTILKHHLDEAYNNISILNDKVTASEVIRLRKDIAIHDTLTLCQKALTGSPYSGYNTPVADYINPLKHSSPILRNNSPIFEQSFLNWPTPQFSGSNSLTNSASSIGGEFGSPVKGNAPILKHSSPFIRTVSPLVESSRFYTESDSLVSSAKAGRTFMVKGHSHNLSGDTAVLSPITSYSDADWGMASSATYSATSSISPIISTSFEIKNEGLYIDILNLVNKDTSTITDGTSNITKSQDYNGPRKYPIRETVSPSNLKRYGNIWQNNFDVESPSTIKRYGWVSPAGTSVLEDYSPLAQRGKRDGHVFPDTFSLRKDYHVITEHNNVYKSCSPHVD